MCNQHKPKFYRLLWVRMSFWLWGQFGISSQSHGSVQVPHGGPNFNHVIGPGVGAPRWAEDFRRGKASSWRSHLQQLQTLTGEPECLGGGTHYATDSGCVDAQKLWLRINADFIYICPMIPCVENKPTCVRSFWPHWSSVVPARGGDLFVCAMINVLIEPRAALIDPSFFFFGAGAKWSSWCFQFPSDWNQKFSFVR